MIETSRERPIVIEPDQMNRLVKYAAPGCVSIWAPLHTAGAASRANPIRLRNLLGAAEDQLAESEIGATEAKRRIGALREALDDAPLGRRGWPGVCGLIGEGDPFVLHLPAAPPETFMVSDHFFLKPLFGTVQQDARFYILALSENRPRLLRASRFAVEPIDLPGAPANFAEFMRFDDPERHIQFHTGAASHQPGGRRPGRFHGQGGGGADEEWEKRRLLDYCRAIDEAVIRAIAEDPAPVLPAGAEPIHGAYRRVSDCAQLDKRLSGGNPDNDDDDELHRRAVDLLSAAFTRPVRQAIARREQAREADLVSDDLEEILRAASVHAVDTLFVRLGDQRWGRFDPAEGVARLSDLHGAGDADLLNLAAVLAARGGATVHALETDDMPARAEATATLRFRID